MNTYVIIILVSALVIVSYLFQVFSKKTSIPAVLLLMVLGMVCGVFLPSGTTAGLDNYLGLLGKVGLILIVLEASIDLRLRRDKVKDIVKAFVSALVGLIITSGVIMIIIGFFTSTDWKQAGLYAVPFAVMSSAIVIPSVSKLLPKAKEFVIYESSLSDILGIILFNLFVDLNKSGDSGMVVVETGGKLIITLLLAVILSYLLLLVFTKIKDETKLFLIITSLVLFYAVGGLFHLSALIMVMVFGLILGNPNVFFRGRLMKWFDIEETNVMAHDLHKISLESAFLIKTFFFFLFGLSINLANLLDFQGLVIGVLIIGATYGIRYVILYLLKVEGTGLLTTITPRGLISVLLFFSISGSMVIDGFGEAAMLITIMATNVIMTIGLIRDSKNVVKPVAESVFEEEANPMVDDPIDSKESIIE